MLIFKNLLKLNWNKLKNLKVIYKSNNNNFLEFTYTCKQKSVKWLIN